MRRAIHQKVISFGAKQSGKIEGGMYFVNNPTTALTDLSTGAFMSIGSGAGVTQLPFVLQNSNEYFEILQTSIPTDPQTVAQYQKLRYLKGRNSTTLTLNWGVSLIKLSDDAPAGNKIELRVSKTNVLGVSSIIDQTQISAGVFQSYSSNILHSTILTNVNILDSYFIEIADQDLGIDVSVSSAFISLSE